MRQLNLRSGHPKRRGYAREMRRLARWVQRVGQRLPEPCRNGLGEWNAYEKPPLRGPWCQGPGAGRYGRAVMRAVVQAAAAWRALRPEGQGMRVVGHLHPEDLWSCSLDVYWQAEGMAEWWAKNVASGCWAPLPPQASLLAELGLPGLLPEWGLSSTMPSWEEGVSVTSPLWLVGDVGDHSRAVPAEA